VAKLYAGTSGFSYPSWKPDFYPEKLPTKKFLNHYATRLNAVEINYTFRQLPKASTLEGWLEETPPGFCFVCKAHQRITHPAPGDRQFTEPSLKPWNRCASRAGWDRFCFNCHRISNSMRPSRRLSRRDSDGPSRDLRVPQRVVAHRRSV
jgi:uncharacterized protein YecE (DUF72 family)